MSRRTATLYQRIGLPSILQTGRGDLTELRSPPFLANSLNRRLTMFDFAPDFTPLTAPRPACDLQPNTAPVTVPPSAVGVSA